MEKKCNCCNLLFDISCFKKHASTADRHSNFCRKCTNKKNNEYRSKNKNLNTHRYEKNKSGFLVRCYRNMKSRVTGIQKPHLYKGLPILDKHEFYNWSNSNREFNLLFIEWINSEYERKLTPSIDRIDSKKGYILENIRWITNSENSRLGILSRHSKSDSKNIVNV